MTQDEFSFYEEEKRRRSGPRQVFFDEVNGNSDKLFG